MSKRKRKPLPPRRKRMKRAARLESARHWLPTFPGKNVVRGYARWFGVDHLCAVKELRMLGIAVDPTYVAMLERTREEMARANAAARASRSAAADAPVGEDMDDIFAFIAGRTSGGAAYGVTWEEFEALEHGHDST